MTSMSFSFVEDSVTVGSVNPHLIWIRRLLDSRQDFPHLQFLLIYSISSGIQVRVHAALVRAVTVCWLNVSHSLFLGLWDFFPLIHVSDSRRGALKSAAPRCWRTVHTAGV